MSRFSVKLFARDITEGKMKSRRKCPVAIALRRIYPESSIKVYSDHVKVDDLKLPLSPYIARWIENFDVGLAVKPITLWFNTPS